VDDTDHNQRSGNAAYGSSDAAAASGAVAFPRDDERERADGARTPGHWRYEMRRWIATLNPGRTGHEYAKAVAYFFDTPGVPQVVSDLSFDLLLAYRGALALRAASPERGGAHVTRMPHSSAAALETPDTPIHDALPGPKHAASGASEQHDDSADAQAAMHPLAPATVNIRLTALRQFLVHCSMMGLLTDLSPDRVRMALKRLQIERRRPYQILAESEWAEFLAAAAQPAKLQPAPQGSDISPVPEPLAADPPVRRSPWGIPRAARASQAAVREAAAGDGTSGDGSSRAASAAQLARSRAGLTGGRTAQRDHALIALALATGLRAIEISLLDLNDLKQEWHGGQEEWWLVLPDAKTKGQHGGRTLPLATSLVAELLAYVRSTGRQPESATDRSTPLFLSHRKTSDAHQRTPAHRRLTAGQIGRIVDRVEAQWIRSRSTSTGETRAISPHALRHSTAMALLEGSADGTRPPASVEHVRGWLGHFDIRTTQGYLAHLDSRAHRRPLKIALPADTPSGRDSQAEANQDDGDNG
jgi:site-specific recombinase XerD